jgi:hypothetical protein
VHQLDINIDQSGTAFIGIEANALGMFANIANQYLDEKSKKEILQFPLQSANLLKGIDGITNVESLTRIESGKIGVRFRFRNEKALNEAYYALAGIDKKALSPKMVKIAKHKVKLRNMSPFLIRYVEKNYPDIKKEDYLQYLNVRVKINSLRPIKESTVKQGSLNSDRQSIVYRKSLKEIITEESNMGTHFRY